MQLCEFVVLGLELRQQIGTFLCCHWTGFGSFLTAGIWRIHRRATFTQLGAKFEDFRDDGFLSQPLLVQFGKTRFFFFLNGGDRFAPDGNVHASSFVAFDDFKFRRQRINSLAAVINLGWNCVLADSDAGAGCVQNADRFVRQLARRDIACRKRDGRFDAFVQHLNFMVAFQHGRDAAHHHDRFWYIRFFDLDHLETPCERRVFFDVLFVFSPSRCPDGAQGSTRKRWFQQVGRIASSGGAPCPNQCVRFIYEHDNRHG